MREDVKNLVMPEIDSEDYGSLVISLKVGDELIVGDVLISFLGKVKGQCRFKVSAKKDVPIKRIHHKKTI